MMNFRYIIRCILCISLFITVPTPNANAQVGQAVKSVSKTVGKWFGKKAAKEGAEEVIEQSAKTISKEMAQKVIVKNSAAAIVNPASKFSRNALTDFTSANIKRTMMSKIGSEISESALKATSKEFAQQIGKSSSKEAQELFIKRLGSESSQRSFIFTTKKSLKEASENNLYKRLTARTTARLTGVDALKALDDIPQVKKTIQKLQQQSPAHFTNDKLYIEQIGKSRIVGFEGTPSKIEVTPKGTIRAQAGSTKKVGEMNEFLNNPLPNTKYETEGGLLNYQTDNIGRTTYVECHSSELSRTVQRGSLAAENSTELVIKKGGKQGLHDSGHIQQRSMGGLNESINLLPMKSNLQQHGRWAKFEREERKAIAAGKDVWSRKWITYNPDGSYSIKVELTIDGKTITPKPFDDLF